MRVRATYLPSTNTPSSREGNASGLVAWRRDDFLVLLAGSDCGESRFPCRNEISLVAA